MSLRPAHQAQLGEEQVGGALPYRDLEIVRVVGLPFAGHRHRPEHVLVELAQDQDRPGPEPALAVLLMAHVGAQRAPPHLPLVEEVDLPFMMQVGLDLGPAEKVFLH